jgi:type 1 glutamine amidotransferase
MKRRDFLAAGVAVGVSAFPARWIAADDKKKQKVLYFTRSQGFEHGPVKRNGGELAFSEKLMIELGRRAGFEVECSQDGSVFDGDLDQYAAIAFYTSGNLTKPDDRNKTPPMSDAGKKRLLDAIVAGKGFVGFHSATDTFHSPGPRGGVQAELDPYIAMIGGEFVTHGAQQDATLKVTCPKFPGAAGAGESLRLKEEWYAMKNFPSDLHVILLQETEGMTGDMYQRPPFPATWARMHGKGRVFYTSFGHRDDIWTNAIVQDIILGGFAWAMGNADADVTPNIDKVAPKANELKR